MKLEKSRVPSTEQGEIWLGWWLLSGNGKPVHSTILCHVLQLLLPLLLWSSVILFSFGRREGHSKRIQNACPVAMMEADLNLLQCFEFCSVLLFCGSCITYWEVILFFSFWIEDIQVITQRTRSSCDSKRYLAR